MADTSLPLLKGTLDLLVLKCLSWYRMHGFGIASWLTEYTKGAIGIDDSALYHALHRLEGRGLVEAEWGVTENNRRARYYKISGAGRRYLQSETEIWLRYTRSVTAVLTLAARPA
jgi:PadR family transcriptional regulator, regulatory protein PadR